MIRNYLLKTWEYLHVRGEAGDDGFDAWVNSLTNVELVQYIDNAPPARRWERVMWWDDESIKHITRVAIAAAILFASAMIGIGFAVGRYW